jgi:putative ABC transport system permease protein
MPGSFRFPRSAQAWTLAARDVPSPPLTVEGDLLADRQVHYFNAVARLAPGTTVERARAELSSIAASLGESHPQTNRGQGFGAVPLRQLIPTAARVSVWCR